MAKGASVAELEALHRLVAQSFNARLKQDLEDNLPTDAATLGAAIKFLKDNAVTADPADSDDLNQLREQLAEKAKNRKKRVGNVIALCEEDQLLMEG